MSLKMYMYMGDRWSFYVSKIDLEREINVGGTRLQLQNADVYTEKHKNRISD